MNNETDTSPEIIVKSSDNTRIVSSEELDELLKSEPINTVVRVKDREYKYHILFEDIGGNKFWQEFNGDVEFAKKSHEWFKQGQKLFEEKPLEPDEAAMLRECLLSISTLGNFFRWDPETIEGFLDQLIVTFSQRLYCKHKGIEEISLEELQDNAEFMTYLHASAIFVKAYADLVKEIRDSVKIATDEQTAVDKSV